MVPIVRSVSVTCSLLCLGLALPLDPAFAGADRAPEAYSPPVDAPVVDPFRPPERPYGAGNRGLEYGTAPGSAVRAAGAGLVTFAGPVAGSLHVTVLHPDGLRTTYSYLASLEVARGTRVEQGWVLGRTSGHLHFGARQDGTYLDPASLFGQEPPSVRLVPLELSAAPLAGERRGVLDFIGDHIPRVVGSWPTVPADIRAFLHYTVELRPDVRLGRVARELYRWSNERDDCTSSSSPATPPRERRIAVLVGGLGSTGSGSSIDGLDTEALGYTADDVIRFSYAGGRVPAELDGPLADVEVRDYDEADTEGDLRMAGDRLLELLREVEAHQPGVPVDVIAHSQGGVVARVALLDTAAVPDSLATLVTLGSPHGGADLATAVSAIRERPKGPAILEAFEREQRTGLDYRGVSVGQMAETSDLVADLESTGPPRRVVFRSVGARGDLVVTDGHAVAPGGRHATVSLSGWTAHSRVASDPAVVREVALALTDRPPTCETFSDAALDATVAESLSWAEDLLGAAALAGSG